MVDIYQWIGFAGMLFIVYAYFLLQVGKVDHRDMYYQILNLAGAVLLTISLMVHFNLGSLLIEIFWILITIYAIVKNKTERDKNEKEL